MREEYDPADLPITPYGEDEDKDVGASPNRVGEFIDAAATAGIDSLSTVTLALLLIGAGVLFLVAKLKDGVVSDTALSSLDINYSNIVSWLILGAGLVLLLEVVLRIVMPRFRSYIGGRLALSVLFIAVGVAGLTSVSFALPVFLIGLGIVVIVSRLVR